MTLRAVGRRDDELICGEHEARGGVLAPRRVGALQQPLLPLVLQGDDLVGIALQTVPALDRGSERHHRPGLQRAREVPRAPQRVHVLIAAGVFQTVDQRPAPRR